MLNFLNKGNVLAHQPDTVFIVNPQSNGGKAKKEWDKIEPMINEIFPHSQTFITQKAGDASSFSLSSLCEPHIKKIISVGGDGTNNETLQAFFDKTHQLKRKDCLFGVLPLGTGCDFARTLKLPKNPVKSFRSLKMATISFVMLVTLSS